MQIKLTECLTHCIRVFLYQRLWIWLLQEHMCPRLSLISELQIKSASLWCRCLDFFVCFTRHSVESQDAAMNIPWLPINPVAPESTLCNSHPVCHFQVLNKGGWFMFYLNVYTQRSHVQKISSSTPSKLITQVIVGDLISTGRTFAMQ